MNRGWPLTSCASKRSTPGIRNYRGAAWSANFAAGLGGGGGRAPAPPPPHLRWPAPRRQRLGPRGRRASNITAERLRFDFAFPRRLTPDELRQVEEIVNTQIERDLPVTVEVMPLDQALAHGALAFFGDKYGAQVKVYSIGDFSMEV